MLAHQSGLRTGPARPCRLLPETGATGRTRADRGKTKDLADETGTGARQFPLGFQVGGRDRRSGSWAALGRRAVALLAGAWPHGRRPGATDCTFGAPRFRPAH